MSSGGGPPLSTTGGSVAVAGVADSVDLPINFAIGVQGTSAPQVKPPGAVGSSIGVQGINKTTVQLLGGGGVAHGISPWGWRTVTAAELAYQAMQQGKAATRKPQNYRVIVPEEQEEYRLMEELALAGHALRGICRELKLRGIKTRRAKDFNATTLGKILRDDCYWTGQWLYNKRKTVKPKKLRKPHIERHWMKSTHKWRPRSEWVEPQELPGGPITTKERHEAVLEALKRNGKVGEGRPAAEGGYEAILKRLLKCRLCGYAMVPKQKTTPAGRRCWYECSNRDPVTGKRLCPARSVKAVVLEEAVWDAMCEACTVDLDKHVRAYRDEIIAKTDAAELEQVRGAETRIVAKMTEAIDRELDADEPEEKRRYAQRIAEYKGQLKLVRRRIASSTSVAALIEVDTDAIKQIIQAGMRSQDRAKRRAVLLALVHEVGYAEELAELVLKVPTLPGVNCQHTQPAAGARQALERISCSSSDHIKGPDGTSAYTTLKIAVLAPIPREVKGVEAENGRIRADSPAIFSRKG